MSDMVVTARLVADSSSWVAGFKQADTAARRTAATASTAAAKTQAAQKRQGAAISGGGILALAAGAAIAAYAKKSVDAFYSTAGASIKTQRAMGGTIEQASAYSGAAKLAGIDSERFVKSLGLLDKKLVAANDGGGKAAAMTDALGTSFVKADGHVRPLAEILPQLATKFQGMADGPEKTALALQLFGRSGQQLLPLLNKGGAGIEHLMTRAKELGLVIDQEGVAKFNNYKKATHEFDASLQGLQVSLGSELIPAASSGFGALTKFVEVTQRIPGPVKAATVAILAYAAASALIVPRIASVKTGFTALSSAASVSAVGLRTFGTSVRTMVVGTAAADGAMAGLASATGATVGPMNRGSQATSKMASALKILGKATLIVGAIVALGQAANKLGSVSGAASADVSKMAGSLEELAAGGNNLNDFSNSYNSLSQVIASGVGLTMLGGQARSISQISDDANGASGMLRNAALGVQDFGMSLVGMDSPLQHAKDGFEKIDAGLAQLVSSGKADQAAAAIERLKSQVASEGGDVSAFTNGLSQYNSAVEEAANSTAELTQEIQQYQALTAQSTSVSFKQDLLQLRDSLVKTGGAFNNSKEGLDNQSKALGMATGLAKSYDQQQKQLADAGMENSAAADQVTQAYVRQMSQLAQTIPRTAAGKQAIDGINQAMAAVPGWKPINVSAPGAEAVKAKIDALAQRANMTPKALRIAITQAGADPTGQKISTLARKLGTTPKKLRLIIEAVGGEKAIGDAAKAGSQAGKKLGDGAKAGKGQAKAAGKGIGAAIAEGGKAATAQATQAGQTVGSALNTGAVVGIQASLGAAISAASSAGAQVAQAYKDAAKTHSPSVFGIEVGEGLNDGVLVGIGSTAARTLAGVRAMATRIGTASGEAAARAKARTDAIEQRNLDKMQEKLNKQGLTKKQKKAGKSSGRGDIWRAEADASRDYWKQVADDAAQAAQKIADDAEDARRALDQLREQTTLSLRDSGKGDITNAKSAGSAKSYLTKQLKDVLNFQRNLQTLASRGLPQSLLQSIISKGLDAAPLAASLAKANAADFSKIAATGAALDVASIGLANTGASLFMDRGPNVGANARQTGPMSFSIYIGDKQINELVGAEVNGQVAQIVNKMAYR